MKSLKESLINKKIINNYKDICGNFKVEFDNINGKKIQKLTLNDEIDHDDTLIIYNFENYLEFEFLEKDTPTYNTDVKIKDIRDYLLKNGKINDEVTIDDIDEEYRCLDFSKSGNDEITISLISNEEYKLWLDSEPDDEDEDDYQDWEDEEPDEYENLFVFKIKEETLLNIFQILGI